MFGATILSAVLHATAIVATVVAWPYIAPPELQSDIVPIELIEVAEETNVAPQQESPEPTPEPQQLSMPQMEPPPPEFAPPPPPEDDAPALEDELKPEPPPPEPPKITPPQQRFAMSQPRAKPKPEPKKEEFDLSKVTEAIERAEKQQPKAGAAPAKSKATKSLAGAGAQTALTMDELAALRGRLAKCWNVPVGAPDPASLVFRVRFSLNQDGTVASAPQLLDQGRLADPYFRAAADAAIRAIQICGPYELPPEKYAGEGGWNEITVEFDPTKMAGY